ncbi:MAG: efflux RND transporter permease subunit, partial [Gammaproteobacteria bacterium]|nr:efflux RND transporter permease subunit [Gammaproteobacteria bacterium]
LPGLEATFAIDGVSLGGGASPVNGFSGMVMKPWSDRDVTQKQLMAMIQPKLNAIAGLQTVAFGLPSLPGVSGLPVQFVITTTSDYQILAEVNEKMLAEARNSGLFLFVDSDLNYSQPQLEIQIDRSKAAALGITMQQIGNAVGNLLSTNYVNRFSVDGQSYLVIPEAIDQAHYNPEDLKKIYIKDAAGKLIPLGSIISLATEVQPASLNQFQQLNSVTIQGVAKPGVALPQALAYLRDKLQQDFPSGFGYAYDGPSRQAMSVGNTMLFTFAFALIIIFLVLAAQFESFKDPLIILVSVPMSLSGALLFMNLGLASMNIYTEIGLVTLIGLISKHGILMTEFANKLQETEHLSIHDAIVKAASLRLRPILMTTAAMIFGVLPLLIAIGPGAHSRFDIGLVIATGMLIGTCFTLFVVPTMYTFLAKRHKMID